MAQRSSNQILRFELKMSPAALWQRFCDRVNDDAAGTPRDLSAWLEQLRIDAEALLVKIANKKKQLGDISKYELDTLVRSMNDSAKPSQKTLDVLSSEMGAYRLDVVARLDTKSGKFERTDAHPKSATNKQLVLYARCVAVSTRDWRNFRRCKEPKCDRLFYDDMPRGRRPKRYCKPAHGYAHRQRIRRGGSET